MTSECENECDCSPDCLCNETQQKKDNQCEDNTCNCTCFLDTEDDVDNDCETQDDDTLSDDDYQSTTEDDDEYSSGEEYDNSELDDDKTSILHGRWIYDGSNSIDEMIEALEKEIALLKDLKEDGWVLKEQVMNDYAILVKEDDTE